MMLTNSSEDFVMTSIKCPPPKIVAVKRSLKKSNKANIMDDEDLCLKEDFINDSDSLSSFDSKDLIEFESEEFLIDLSEEPDVPPCDQTHATRDTVSSMNAKNSTTLLSLLDLLEIGNVMRTTETELLGSCARDVVFDTSPFVSKTSSSSSSANIPGGYPGACATSSGKTNHPSSVFPPLSIQPENPSIVKNCSPREEAIKFEVKETLKTSESGQIGGESAREGIDGKRIDSTLQNSHQCQSEKAKENFVSTSIDFSCSKPDCSIKTPSCKDEVKCCNKVESAEQSSDKERENCHYNHHQQQPQQQDNVNSVNSNTQSKVEKPIDQCDSNNNRESVCDQNSLDDSLLLSRDHGAFTDDSDKHLKFLSPHTSQRQFPPNFFSSSTSLNQDNFEASTRLKRLEERFKGFSYTKKLLRSSKVFSKSEEILSSYGKAKELTCEPLNSSINFPLSTSTLSENCLRQLTAEEDCGKDKVKKRQRASSSDEISVLEFSPSRSISLNKQLTATSLKHPQSPESTAESDEICKIFRNKDTNSSESALNQEPEGEEDCSFVYYEEEPEISGSIEDDTTGKHSVFNDLLFSNCEFDVQTFNQYLNEYGDEESEQHKHCPEHNCNSDDEKSDESDFFCDCLVEAVPLYHTDIMRETGGKLRGLLKAPNRPPPARKNRVVFDETRNEFFEADYIILIREDCPYDEEDEEPCTCGDHELVRICCDEGCNCGYTDDGRTPPSPKFAPPIEFVDQATLSPPEGYKDGGLIDSALSGALGNHVFGAQHIQQLQVIQRLQQQRAAMLAARAAAANASSQPSNPPAEQQAVCTECAECAECAAAKLAELEGECDSQCSEDPSPMEVVPPHVLAIGSLVPVQKSSPERRNQKEIVAGEERPKFLTIKQTEDAQAKSKPANSMKSENQASYVVETITMTTVTEHRIIRTAEDANTEVPPPKPPKAVTLQPPALPEGRSIYASSQSVENMKNDLNATVFPKFNVNGTAQAITGILKGGKFRKTDSVQTDETNNTTSDEETSSKRSVRFNEDASGDSGVNCESQAETTTTDDESKTKTESLTDYVTHMSLKRHSSLFHNALRPNSAVRQLFPAKSPTSALTHEALKAFDESKRGGNLLTASQTITSAGSASSASTSPTPITHSASDTDTIKRTIERNALRRSLIKYEPKKKITAKDSTSLEERIRQLTCDIDEPGDSDGNHSLNPNDMERRDSPAGEENPQQTKFDKSFSPSSSASSSSSCSNGSTYKKITDLFNKDKRQEKILETDENPIVIIPQDCRCPAGPDIGMGVQIQGAHTQVHQPPPPPRQTESKRHILSTTLAPLTACVAGQRDDFSYYMLAKPGDRTSTASSQTTDQYSIGDIDAALQDADIKKVAPDVIAGTPGQETDELASFAQQESNRLDRIKKRYSSESAPASGVNSDDDEQNDYGFNKRPSVRGIKPRFGSTNEILQQMQDQLSQPTPTVPSSNQATMQSSTLPRTNASGALQIAPTKSQQAHHQHTASWSYYPEQVKKAGDNYGNYYHLPAHARHSYHGHEAIYQNCHTMTVQQTQAIIPGHLHQKLTQQSSQPQIQAIQHAQQINRLSQYARSPTRRPESPPPLRNYHQTMVLIPYKPDGTTYPAYGIGGETNENIYQRQHNIVEYQQVTQQTIRVPIGYPLPGMQLHVVSGNRGAQATPHYATLPRQNSGQGQQTFAYPDKSSMERGVPEGEAASSQQCDNMPPATCQDGDSNSNSAVPGTVYYAMNV